MTYCDDKDPLDILVICSVDVEPLCLIEAKVIGVMRMVDQGEMDDKIISVALNDKSVNHINDISDCLTTSYNRSTDFSATTRNYNTKMFKLRNLKTKNLLIRLWMKP